MPDSAPSLRFGRSAVDSTLMADVTALLTAIDHGDPTSLYDREPAPNGGRIDVGAYGNTAEATASPRQLVQVLSPAGLEKFEHGQQVALRWHTAGIVPWVKKITSDSRSPKNWFSRKNSRVSASVAGLVITRNGTALPYRRPTAEAQQARREMEKLPQWAVKAAPRAAVMPEFAPGTPAFDETQVLPEGMKSR